MKTTTMRMVLGSMAACFAFGVQAVEPTITDVTVRQRWPWSRLVDIDYILTCDASARADVTLTAHNSTTALTLPAQSLFGDLYSVKQGARRITWDPSKSSYTNEVLTQFSVTLTATNVPMYMIVDLTSGGVSNFSCEADIWPDVTNNMYKTDKLVLRRIPPQTLMMGSSTNETERKDKEDQHPVTLTTPYYIGVFEVTQYQWAKVMNLADNAWPSYFTNLSCRATRPVETVSYAAIRGTNTGTGWPVADLGTGSFFYKLNALSGLSCDLPSEAQWENACRASVTTARYDGHDDSNTVSTLACYFRTVDQGRNLDTTKGTMPAGSYQPNAWGLYDMYGNVWEVCVDHYISHLGFVAATDPLHLDSTTSRSFRGGGYNEPVTSMRSARRDANTYSSTSSTQGFRVWAKVP